jgi:hypothetical protein
MAQATDDSTNTTPTSQFTPEKMRGLAKRLRARAESVLLRHQPEQRRDLLAAAILVDVMAQSSDLLVDITDADGKVSRSVPLWEVIGDDQEEYADCRNTLIADGKCTTGGGAAPVYFLELVGNLILIDMRGGTIVAVTGLPPGAGYLIRHLDAAAGGR